MMVKYSQAKGVPLPEIAVIFTGLLLVVGGITILLGFYPKIGVIALVLFYLPVTFMMHNFWTVSDPGMKTGEMVNFMKNMSIMSSALIFLAIPEPWSISLKLR
jgi:uncharacterized membrane protein YphA (DoxX/SURF4 family)